MILLTKIQVLWLHTWPSYKPSNESGYEYQYEYWACIHHGGNTSSSLGVINFAMRQGLEQVGDNGLKGLGEGCTAMLQLTLPTRTVFTHTHSLIAWSLSNQIWHVIFLCFLLCFHSLCLCLPVSVSLYLSVSLPAIVLLFPSVSPCPSPVVEQATRFIRDFLALRKSSNWWTCVALPAKEKFKISLHWLKSPGT